jgi:inner membrane protein
LPSSVAHAAVAVIANQVLARDDRTRTAVWLAAAAAVAPDLDTLAWVVRGDRGLSPSHRGVSHSLAVAVAAAAIVTILWHWRRPLQSPARAFSYFALAIASHGLLDSLSSYGSGIALLAPFSDQRFRTPWSLFDDIVEELVCLWLPAFVFIRLNIGGFRKGQVALPAVDSSPSRPAG